MAIFLFLEIRDEPVVRLLGELRKIFFERSSNSPIHVTVRGPYLDLPSANQLTPFWDDICADGVFLNGVSHFEIGDRWYVFLRAKGKSLRRIWWKRDFPINQFGFNPHITLYEGPAKRAREIERFLRRERLDFVCSDLSLRFHDTMQPDLWSRTDLELSTPETASVLIREYRWKDGIEQRARDLMASLDKERTL